MKKWISDLKDKQWDEPFRLIYKGWGFTVWKYGGVIFPLWNIWLGRHWSMGYECFHNGYGVSFFFPPIIIIDICTKGDIGGCFGKCKFRIRINKWEFKY